jgi:hypothetical protein
MTKAQRAYTQQYVTVEQSPKQQREQRGWTAYLVTHNPLMATERRKVIQAAPSYRDAATIARGYAQASGIKLSSRVEGY